jgi:PASTA domain
LIIAASAIALMGSASASGAPVLTSIDPGNLIEGLACPSTSQCTAVDGVGDEVTFDPGSRSAGTRVTIDSDGLLAVACSSRTECTAVDAAGRQVTFDPAAPGSPTPTTIDTQPDAGGFVAIACPATDQCTAVNQYSGSEVTFDPTSPTSPTPTEIDPGAGLLSVACPATTQCTAVDSSGNEITFDPAAPASLRPAMIDHLRLGAVACPSVSQCTAGNGYGDEVTFDLAAPGTPQPKTLAPGLPIVAVACPSASRCTAVGDGAGGTQVVTFDPVSPGAPAVVPIDSDNATDVACPSTTTCVAVDQRGRAVTFSAIPASQTASGTLTSLSHYQLIMDGAPTEGPGTYCKLWKGALRTASGSPLSFIIAETFARSGNKLTPTDPTAIRTYDTIEKGAADAKRGAAVRISYIGSEIVCGDTAPDVVTSASVTLPKQKACVVPKLVGRSLKAARMALKSSACRIGKITRRKSSSVPNGVVIATSPKPGSRRTAGAAVALIVSRGER